MTRFADLKRPAFAALGVLGLGLVSVASAQQEQAGGKTVVISVGQTLRYGDNLDFEASPSESKLQFRTFLGASFDSITRNRSFQLDFGGNYEADTEGQSDLDQPYARLSYAQEGTNSRISLSGNYRRVDVDDSFGLISSSADPEGQIGEPTVARIALIEGGVRTNTDYTLGFETGLQSPIGFKLDLEQRSRSYSQTTDPDLFATDALRAAAQLDLRITPQVTTRLTARTSLYEAEDADQTERTETTYGVGMAYDISPILQLNASLRQQEIETDRISGVRRAEGLAAAVDLSQTLRNGVLAGSLTSEETLNGRRDTVQVTRSMTLRREGALSYGLGLSKTGDFSAEPLINISYTQPLRRSRFSVNFTQEARTEEDDDTSVVLSRLQANYAQPLSPTVNWSLAVGLSDIETSGATGEDRRRIDLRTNLGGQINDVSSWSAGVTISDTGTSDVGVNETQRRYSVQMAYRRALPQDWDMVARYEHQTLLDSTQADRRSNIISLGIKKNFVFRP